MNELVFKIKYGAVLIVLVAAFALLFIKPTLERRAQADTAVTAMRAKLNDAKVNSQRVADGKLRLETLRRRAAEEIRDIPERSMLADLMRHITLVSDSLPLGEQRISAAEKELATGPYLYTTLTIETTGTFDGVFELVRDLESQARTLRVREITIEQADLKQPGTVTAHLEVEVLYQTPQKESSEARSSGQKAVASHPDGAGRQ